MNGTRRPSALGGYEDWPAFVRQPGPLASSDGGEGAAGLAAALGLPAVAGRPAARTDSEVVEDGLRTTELSWQLGYGPRTAAFFVRPERPQGPLPGVLLMHCHGGNKWLGAERLVDLGGRSSPEAVALRRGLYGGRAFASSLARRGMAVLAHDTFAWGSRRFNLSPAPWRTAGVLEAQQALWREKGVSPSPSATYNILAADHEHTVAKAAGLLGTSFAGMVSHDDLAALAALGGLPDVDGGRLGTAGFSGGGGRAMMVAALSGQVRSQVVACMMTTFESLLPSYLDAHSWLMQTPGLWAFADWPQIPSRAAAHRQSMLVQFAAGDALFPLSGMRRADSILAATAGPGFSYESSWTDGGHVMTVRMQEDAADFLLRTL